MDLSSVIIETERLRLVPVSRKYAESIFSGYREPVTRHMDHPPPESLEEIRERLEQLEIAMRDGKELFLSVLLKATGEFLGGFSLEDLDKRTPEMGGWLKHSAHGHRYGREAAAAIRHWADQHLDYEYLRWPCVAVNIPSRKVAESLGGTVRKEFEKRAAKYVEYWIPRGR